jgi:hypothetical protein
MEIKTKFRACKNVRALKADAAVNTIVIRVTSFFSFSWQ